MAAVWASMSHRHGKNTLLCVLQLGVVCLGGFFCIVLLHLYIDTTNYFKAFSGFQLYFEVHVLYRATQHGAMPFLSFLILFEYLDILDFEVLYILVQCGSLYSVCV
eukprot:scpid94638/ scgid14423/ 